MQTLGQIRRLLEERGLRPRKSLGQNFLIDQNLLRKLVTTAGVGDGDLVLEIGPGTGTLTEELLSRGCRVVACELDEGLADLLSDRLGDHAGFTLVRGDCLAGKRALAPSIVDRLGREPFTLVANLPYGAATPVLMALLIDHEPCSGMYVTIQREVAERVLACPSTKAYGAISVVAQALARVERLATAPPECFWPRPDVTSTLVAIRRHLPCPIHHPASLAAFCLRAFVGRRKQVGSVLGRQVAAAAGIEPSARVEALSVEQIVSLWRGERPANTPAEEP